MNIVLFKLLALLVIEHSRCTIVGVSYIDQMSQRNYKPIPKGSDPCNPLYWYPRHIPEYCQYKKPQIPGRPEIGPIPMPIPVPYIPQPPPAPIAQIFPIVPPPPMISPSLPLSPHPMMPMPGIPLQTLPGQPGLIPYPGIPAPYPPQTGMVPGIPGIVSHDGGINILPFSDVYSDMLEKNKQKMMRKKLRKVFKDYENYPRSRHRRRKRPRNVYFE